MAKDPPQRFFPNITGPLPGRDIHEQSIAETGQSDTDVAQLLAAGRNYTIPQPPPGVFDTRIITVPAGATNFQVNLPSNYDWVAFYFPITPVGLTFGPNAAIWPVLSADFFVLPNLVFSYLFTNTSANSYTVYLMGGYGDNRPQIWPGQPPTGNLANSDSAAYEASRVIKATSGILYSLSGYNSGPAQFIQLFNATALPADASVPAVVIAVAATSNFSIDFGYYGRIFSLGIVVCNSTTGPTKTIGAANCWFDARYQ